LAKLKSGSRIPYVHYNESTWSPRQPAGFEAKTVLLSARLFGADNRVVVATEMDYVLD